MNEIVVNMQQMYGNLGKDQAKLTFFNVYEMSSTKGFTIFKYTKMKKVQKLEYALFLSVHNIFFRAIFS